MRMCMTHWDTLKDAIKARGLYEAVSHSGKDVAAKLVDQNTGVTSKNFDPLMYAHNRILENLMSIGGAAVMLQDGCPICYATKVHDAHCKEEGCTFTYDGWIDKAADEALEVHKGLV